MNHTLILCDREQQFINKQPSYAVVWHINCTIVAISQAISHNAHNVEVLVIIEDEVRTTTTTTTTTTTPVYSDIPMCLNCGTIPSRLYVYMNNKLNVMGYTIAKRNGRLSNYKYMPIFEGFTYGYYNHTLRVRREGKVS